MKKPTLSPIETRRVSLLKPHPSNEKIYGKEKLPNDDALALAQSIREKGILVPLIVTKNNIVVSGHRRLYWALEERLETVPVQTLATEDKDLIEALLIHSNRQRLKTKVQLAREAKRLKEIEAAKADTRKKSGKGADGSGGRGKKKNLGENFPEGLPNDNRASAKVGKALGVSGKTADKMAAVATKAEELREAGEGEKADELESTLENESVDAAYKKTKPQEAKPKPKPQKKEPLTQSDAARLARLKKEWDQASVPVRRAFREFIS